MPSAVRLARISETALSLDEHISAVESATSGAMTTFVGRVRDHDPDATDAVVALEYSSHPDAEATLRGITQVAVVIAVASAHRDEAFTVCREIIEAIKSELPVWKRQIESDGTTAWKGLGS